MYFDTKSWLLLSAVCACASARGWTWPEGAESVRIDTKVRFVDDDAAKIKHSNKVQSDEAPFHEPTDTDGFYNRPPGAGRYRVRVTGGRAAYRLPHAGYDTQHDNQQDAVQSCKCVSTPDCNPRHDSAEVCGANKYLCCLKRPNSGNLQNTEFFNEIDDERPMLFPGKENTGGPFPPPPPYGLSHGPQPFMQGAGDADRAVLVGPSGPTGEVSPAQHHQPTLFGPAGSTSNFNQIPVLSGPNGPTGVIGPHGDRNIDSDASAQRGILVGPGGPTGVIGPYQRPVLTGPGGPTGSIRPGRGGGRGVLVGPGGPTGIVGPYGRQGSGYERHSGPGLLAGPGGPTGIIGPGRQLLVGPGGPTGHIGPQRYYDHELTKRSRANITSAKTQKSQIMEEKKTENSDFGISTADAVIPGQSRMKRSMRNDQRRRQVKKHRTIEQHKQKKLYNQKQHQRKKYTETKKWQKQKQRTQKRRLEKTNTNQQKKRQIEQQKQEQAEEESEKKRGVRGCTSCVIQPAQPRRRPAPARPRRPCSTGACSRADDPPRPPLAQRRKEKVEYEYEIKKRPPHKPGQKMPIRITTTTPLPIWKRMKFGVIPTKPTTTTTVKPSIIHYEVIKKKQANVTSARTNLSSITAENKAKTKLFGNTTTDADSTYRKSRHLMQVRSRRGISSTVQRPGRSPSKKRREQKEQRKRNVRKDPQKRKVHVQKNQRKWKEQHLQKDRKRKVKLDGHRQRGGPRPARGCSSCVYRPSPPRRKPAPAQRRRPSAGGGCSRANDTVRPPPPQRCKSDYEIKKKKQAKITPARKNTGQITVEHKAETKLFRSTTAGAATTQSRAQRRGSARERRGVPGLLQRAQQLEREDQRKRKEQRENGQTRKGQHRQNGQREQTGQRKREEPHEQNSQRKRKERYEQIGQRERNKPHHQNGQRKRKKPYEQNGQRKQNEPHQQNGQRNRKERYEHNGQRERNEPHRQNGQRKRKKPHKQNGQRKQKERHEPNGQRNQNEPHQQNDQRKRKERYEQNSQRKRKDRYEQNSQRKRKQRRDGHERAGAGGVRQVRGCTSCVLQPPAPRRRPAPAQPRRRRPCSTGACSRTNDTARPPLAQRRREKVEYVHELKPRPPHKPGQHIHHKPTTSTLPPYWKRMKYGFHYTTTTTTTTVKPSIFRKLPIFLFLIKVIKFFAAINVL